MEEMIIMGVVKISKEETPMSKVKVASIFRNKLILVVSTLFSIIFLDKIQSNPPSDTGR